METPKIGRKALESLGCENRDMLIVACDRQGDNIGVAEKLKEDGYEEENEGMIAALYTESLFRRGGHVEDDGLRDEDVSVELGPIEEVEKKLQERFKEARANGFLERGTTKMEQIIKT